MEHENYIRLQRLLQYGRKVLEKHLDNQWKDQFGIYMSDESQGAIRSFFLRDKRGQFMMKKFDRGQRGVAMNERPCKWDISLLAKMLRSDPFKSSADNQARESIASVRNDLAHRSSMHFNDADFHHLWRTLTVALYHFDAKSPAEIESIRTVPVKDLTGAEHDTLNKTAHSFKERGNSLYTKQKYREAVLAYSEAMQLQNLPDRMMATLLSNRAMCYLNLSDPKSALDSAIRCQQVQPHWFKAYVRLGQSYMALDTPDIAVEELDRALQLLNKDGKTRDRLLVQKLKWSAHRRMVVRWTGPGDIFEEDAWTPPIPGQEHVKRGHLYYFGTESITQNTERAIAEYNLGASKKNAEAMYCLATVLLDTPSVLDFATAHALLLRAADMSSTLGKQYGHVPRMGVNAAQYMLGVHHQHGIYVPRDVLRAVSWYERAVSNNNSLAAYNLGLVYLHGERGLDRNLSKAEELFLRAYRGGEVKAASNLAVVYTRLAKPVKVKRWCEVAKSHGTVSK